MNHRKKMQRLVSGCMAVFLLCSSSWQAKADIVGSSGSNTSALVGGFVSVLSLAGPEGAAAAMVAGYMKTVMGMLGFFNDPDPTAVAIQQINAELQQINSQLNTMESQIQSVQNQVFSNANLQNTRLLRDQTNAIQQVQAGLADQPQDKFTKDQLVVKAQQACDTFVADDSMWMYSDLDLSKVSAKNPDGSPRTQAQIQQDIAAAPLLPPSFKPAPTLQVYATALATWMAAIEYSTGGDQKVYAANNYNNEVNVHIQRLALRAGWNNLNMQPSSIAEQITGKIRGQYVPTTRSPDNTRHCVIAEYIIDDFARTTKLVGNETYITANINDMCTVPQSLLNFATPTEQTYQNQYGLDVINALVQNLTYMRDHGTIRQQYMGNGFNTTLHGGESIYHVKADSYLYWIGDNITTTALQPGQVTRNAQNITHQLTPEVKQYASWGEMYSNIIPGGGGIIYAVQKNGVLTWFNHTGTETGAVAWLGGQGGGNAVGTGWNNFKTVFGMGDGVIYGILPDGTLRWYQHKLYLTGKAGPGSWAPSVDVGTGWNNFKFVFGGGQGVIYAVTQDGHLKWYKHDCANPQPLPPAPVAPPPPVRTPPRTIFGMPNPAANVNTQLANMNANMQAALKLKWQKSWQGPTDIGTGWNNFTKLWCAGNGHIYGVLPSGEVRAYDHVGFAEGSPRWGNDQKIADGWQSDIFDFCRMPGGPDPLVVK
jgi:TolA-binding protein